MKSLERRFKQIQKENEYWSDYTCFAEAVKGQKFTSSVISRHFKLIDKNEYAPKDKIALLEYLFELTAEEHNIWG